MRARLLRTLFQDDEPRAAAWSSDGAHLAVTCAEGEVGVWTEFSDTTIRIPVSGRGQSSVMPSIRWHPGGDEFACAGSDALIFVNPAGRRLRSLYPPEGERITTLAWSPDGQTLAYVAQSHITVGLWHRTTGAFSVCQTAGGVAKCVAWSIDSKQLAVGSEYGEVSTCTAQGEVLKTCASPTEERTLHATCLAWTETGVRVVSGYRDGTLRLWDVADGVVLHCRQLTNGSLVDIAHVPSRSAFAVASDNGSVNLLCADTLSDLAVLPGNGRWVGQFQVGVKPDGSAMAVPAYWNRCLRMFAIDLEGSSSVDHSITDGAPR